MRGRPLRAGQAGPRAVRRVAPGCRARLDAAARGRFVPRMVAAEDFVPAASWGDRCDRARLARGRARESLAGTPGRGSWAPTRAGRRSGAPKRPGRRRDCAALSIAAPRSVHVDRAPVLPKPAAQVNAPRRHADGRDGSARSRRSRCPTWMVWSPRVFLGQHAQIEAAVEATAPARHASSPLADLITAGAAAESAGPEADLPEALAPATRASSSTANCERIAVLRGACETADQAPAGDARRRTASPASSVSARPARSDLAATSRRWLARSTPRAPAWSNSPEDDICSTPEWRHSLRRPATKPPDREAAPESRLALRRHCAWPDAAAPAGPNAFQLSAWRASATRAPRNRALSVWMWSVSACVVLVWRL